MTDQNTSTDREVNEFLAEAEEIVEQLVSEMGDLADCSDLSNINPDLVNSIFRSAHSLKGLSGMFGFSTVAELAHNMESLLENLRLGRVRAEARMVSVLLESAELLSSLIRSIPAGNSRDFSSDIASAIISINACLEQEDGVDGGVTVHQLGLPERILSSLTEFEEYRLKHNLETGKNIYSIHVSFDMGTFDQDLTRISDLIRARGELISTLPGIGEHIETNIDFDILFSSETGLDGFSVLPELQDASLQLLNEPKTIKAKAADAAPLQPLGPHSLPGLPDFSAGTTPESAGSAKSMSGTVRVDIGKLDDLMNIVGELVQSHSSIAMLAAAMRNEGFSHLGVELGKVAKQLERRLVELQKGVMEIRLVPVGQLYDKMSRIVRRISREQGKKVRLAFLGADTELDKLLVEEISDPLMHIIRNAIDHGIEPPEQRLKKGKQEQGVIRISSFQRGNSVVIEIEDDGNGMDAQSIRKRALEKGLIQDLSAIDDRQALDIIFMPGFSTADSVSEVSGRGVGMDVVRNNITAISGTIDVETVPGCGSRFIITLPITLAIIKVLLVSSAGRSFAMPISSVRETVMLKAADIETVEQKEVVLLRSSTIPLVRLDRFLGFAGCIDIQQSELFMVVVGSDDRRIGIVVDELTGQQDIVIKPLGDSFKGFNGISGAADLGDLGTILVLDVAGIISETRKNGN